MTGLLLFVGFVACLFVLGSLIFVLLSKKTKSNR